VLLRRFTSQEGKARVPPSGTQCATQCSTQCATHRSDTRSVGASPQQSRRVTGNMSPRNGGMHSRSPSPRGAVTSCVREKTNQGLSATVPSRPRRTSPPSFDASVVLVSPRRPQVLASQTLARVPSDRVLGGRSPRMNQKDSRSPSPGALGRASPPAPRVPRIDRAQMRKSDLDRERVAVPRRAEAVKAPTRSSRSAVVCRSVTAPSRQSTARNVGSNGHLGLADVTKTSGTRRTVGRPLSVDRSAAKDFRSSLSMAETSGSGSVEHWSDNRCSDDEVASCLHSESDDSDDDDVGPCNRRLTAEEYEAVVRCAQEVVAWASQPTDAPPSWTAPPAPRPKRRSMAAHSSSPPGVSSR